MPELDFGDRQRSVFGGDMRDFFISIAVLGSLTTAALAAGGSIDSPACDLHASDAKMAGAGCARLWFDTNLHINEIQTAGTAESYKLAPSAQMLSLIKMGSKEDADALNFAEPPIARQLDANARSLEFDVAYDPKGGLFKYPAGASMVDELIPDDYVATMSAPGFKVIHVIDIDFHSSCLTLMSCLKPVADWSRAHPTHVPIVIMLRSNDERTPMPGATRPLKFDEAAFDALDAEILSVFKPEELITPDKVQKDYPTLHEALVAHGWPALGEARGKVLFALDDTAKRVALYRGARRSLEGRVMFVNTEENSPVAAFVTVEDPAQNSARVIADVKAGLLVHTFADANAMEPRKSDTLRRDWAFASGAQIVSTDFIYADKSIGSYEARLSNDHRAQCDVQLSPERCAGLGVERGNDVP